MDDSQYYYLRPNKYLMSVLALWPHQTTLAKTLVSIAVIPIIVIQVTLQVGEFATSLDDQEALVECFALIIISSLAIAKFFNCFYHHKEMKDLLITMEKDWKRFTISKDELRIMEECYHVGRKVTLGYAGALYGFMLPFMALPTAGKVLSLVGIGNKTDEKPLVFRVQNFVDLDKYYYPLLLHTYIGTLTFITIGVAVDSMIMFYVQHECAICEVLGYRLRNSIDDTVMDVELYPSREEDEGYRNLRECVILHKHIIEYGRRLDDANTVSFFLQLGLNMIAITFTSFQAAVKLDKPNEALRYAFFTMSVTFVLLLGSWPGQQILDYTNRINEAAMSGKWYNASMSARKLVSIILMRSLVPIKLTAGRFYTVNLENFAMVVRTSFSYFTVLCSMQ